MKKLSGIIVLLSAFSLCLFSCSQAPQLAGNPYSFQKKLEATHHWEILAKDFSKQLAAYLGNNQTKFGGNYVSESNMTADNTASTQLPIYIQTNDRSVFGKAFRQSLITELTDLGYQIAYNKDDALTLRWSVQKIKYNADRKMSVVQGT